MHVSLDSALGRQRRLNQIGETITSIATPTAAYSLRSLTGGDPLAVRVRRLRDNDEEDFTVSGINSGALLNHINENGVFQNTGFETFDNASATGFIAANTGSIGFAASPLAGNSGTQVSVSFDISITNGSPKLMLRTALDGSGDSASSSVTYTSSGSKTHTFTATDNYVSIAFTEGDVPSNFTVSNFKILGDGSVSIWYDQIGSNNLVQTDLGKQPLIVDSGSLFLNADGNAGISVERSSTRETKLDFTSGFTIANSHTFQYLEFRRTFVHSLLSASGGGNIRTGRQSGTNLQILNGGSQNFDSGITVNNNPFLYTTFLAADGSASKVHVNGVEKQNTVYPNRDASQPNFVQIGKAGSNLSTPSFILSELLMYSSEQSNRAAIEANMDSKYSIF